MAQFLADIAGMLELFSVAAGLVLLHRAGREAAPGLLKLAGWLLVVGGLLVGACTTYYWFQYLSQGELGRAHPRFSQTAPHGMEEVRDPLDLRDAQMTVAACLAVERRCRRA